MNCMETGSKELFQHIPAEANVPIAVSPDHTNSMMHMGHSTGTKKQGIVRIYSDIIYLLSWIDSFAHIRVFSMYASFSCLM